MSSFLKMRAKIKKSRKKRHIFLDGVGLSGKKVGSFSS